MCDLAWRQGDRERAGELYQTALAGFVELGHENDMASAISNLGILAATRGEYPLAEERMRTALNHYIAIGDRFKEASTRKNLGQVLVDQDLLDAAAEQLEQSLAIRRTLELPLHMAMTMSSLADLEMQRGNWPEALAKFQAVVETAMENDSPNMQGQALADLSMVLRRLGRLEESRQAAAGSYQVGTELGSESMQAFALFQQGRAEHDFGHWQQAIDLFERSQSLFVDIGQPLHVELARVAQAESLIATGRYEQAAALLETAERHYQEGELDFLGPGLASAQAYLAKAGGALNAALELQRGVYQTAKQGESLIAQLDSGGVFGLLLLATDADQSELTTLVNELSPRAEISAAELEFLVHFYRQTDPSHALQLAQRWQRLVGDGWSSEQAQLLVSLQEQVRAAG